MLIQTEYEFELPHGYADDSGTLHRRGTMRLACAADEILPMSDVRVQQNPAYLTIIILARVITKLGTIPQVDTKIVEKLFTADLAYGLKRGYEFFVLGEHCYFRKKWQNTSPLMTLKWGESIISFNRGTSYSSNKLSGSLSGLLSLIPFFSDNLLTPQGYPHKMATPKLPIHFK